MPVTCQRCGGTFAETEVGDRFHGTCPKCLAAAAIGSTAGAPQTPADDLPLFAPGQTFQGLEVVERIGAGGMGVVYKARQPNLDRLVALKVLPRHLAGDPDFVERFRREAKALASLSHANIVGVHDFGVAGDVPYLVMEYVDGVNLRALLGEKRLAPEQAFKIVPQLCDALEYAHEEGIVHRDIKPENILVDRKGRVKIADFGLAKILGGDRTALSPITRTGHVMGTPTYMAPEQYEDPKRVDHRADIYSMGVVFYEMLTGELPMGIFAPPSQKVQMDVRFDEVVLKALAKEPERRYQHASEVKNEVTRITVSAPATKSDEEVQRNAKKVIRLAKRAQFFAVLAIMLIGVAMYQMGSSIWESLRSSYAKGPSSGPAAPSQTLPAWIARLEIPPDDIPGVCTLSAASCSGVADVDLRRVASGLHNANLEPFDRTAIRSARLVILDPGPIGFVAFEAKDAPMAEALAASVGRDQDLPRWSWTRGTQGVVAFLSPGTRPPAKAGEPSTLHEPKDPELIAAFEQLANWLAARLGAKQPFKPRTAWDVLLSENDLPIGVSIERSAGWSADTGEEGKELLAELQTLLEGFKPEGIAKAAWLRTSPVRTGLVALDMPKRSDRLRHIESLGPSSEWRRVAVFGTVVVVCQREGTSALALEEYAFVKSRWEQRVGLAPTDETRLPEALRDAAAIPEELATTLQMGQSMRSLDDLLDARLTSLLLQVRSVADVERAQVNAGGKLYTTMRSKGRWIDGEPRMSVLHPSFVKSIRDGMIEVEVPEAIRFTVGFATRRGEVVEFRLPKSDRRLLRDDGAWSILPMRKADARVSIASEEADARFLLDRIARLAGADLVCGDWPTTRVRIQLSDAPWAEALASTASAAGAEALVDGSGVVRVRRKVPFARKAPQRPAPAPDDPRVTLDVEQADVRETILRFAEAGRANVVMAEQVRGRCSARLVDVPWCEALCGVADASGNVAWRDRAGIIRVTQAWKGDLQGEQAAPAPVAADAPRVTIDLRDADLREVITLLARQAGKNVVLGVEDSRRITAVLHDVPWMDALAAVAWTSGLYTVEEGGIVRLVVPPLGGGK